MTTVTQKQNAIQALIKQIGDIRANTEAEARELSSIEQGLIKDCLDRVDELERQIKLELRLETTKNKLNASVSDPIKQDPSDTIYAGSIEVKERKQDRFVSLGEQLMAVYRAGAQNGSHTDPRLYRATGLNEGIPSEGGFLLQQEFSTNLLKRVYETGVLASRCNRLPIGGNSNGIKIPRIVESSRANGSRWGGIRAYWKDEGQQKTASKPAFGQVELSLKKLVGLCYTTDELLQDAVALESYITQGFQEEFGFKIDDAIVNGSGAGQPLGVINAPCLVSVSGETGQDATTIIFENIVKMWSRMFAPCRRNAVWLINQDVEPQLYSLSLVVGTGGVPVYMPPTGLSQTGYATLFGRPVIPVEQCSTLGTLGDILLCDFTQYLLAEKGGIQSDSSIHLKFDYDELVYRFIYRCDGQPWWATALTPYSGSTNTLSPFVGLATRS